MTRRLTLWYQAVGHRRLGWVLGGFIAMLLLLLSGLLTGQVSLRAGELATRDIYAPRRELNQPLYQQLKAQALRSVQPVYVTDQNALPNMQSRISGVFTTVAALQLSLPKNTAAAAAQAAWTEQVGISLPQANIVQILALSPQELSNLQHLAAAVASRVLQQANYQPSQLSAERDALSLAVEALGLNQASETYFLTAVERQAATPNMRVSQSETALARSRAIAAVPPPVIEQGQLLIQRGARVTKGDIALLRQYGLLNGQENWPALAGALALAAAALAVLLSYLQRFFPHQMRDHSNVGLVIVLTVGELALARLALVVSPYLVPLAAVAVLGAMLFDARIGLAIGLVDGLVLQAAFGIDPRVTVVLAIETFVGALAVQRLADRNQLLRAGGAVALSGVLALGTLELLGAPFAPDPTFWPSIGWILIGSVISVGAPLAAAPLLENGFGVLTSLRLLELSSPSQPLLRRLLLEAPGTYYHSLVVSNLAGAGCDAIGAQSLLTRVGAFYHDIGKMRRPYFFIDNQTDMDNPHDKLSPMLSTLVITSHVKDGLELAQEYRLPRDLWRFIAEHHGTTLVQFFYHKATELHPENPPREEDFRYPGPKPQSRETGVLMLADTCEAAVRAIRGRTTGGIEATVKRLIQDRLYEGQLDETDLTLRDLDRVGKAFVRVLSAVHHTRVEYQTQGLEELLRRRG